ncbi:hemagglutinin repeat-containing protein [uncultured Fusobacterium sp.]|uniref:hemagglutinin repeat-containing protein n=1 Tax=uncultured Fusobacterium sp. TaxID=159267 RepID=UPI00342FC859
MASENLEGIVSTDVNSYITVSAGVNKSKSEYHSSSESTVKNKLESKGDINISSGAGSVIIEGTDIKTEKDLNLSASKDVVVKSSKDEYSSSSSSSSKGLNADLTVSTNPKDMLGSVTASQSKGKGNSEGTVNVNSKFEVGGTHKVEAGEKVIYEGANVEAGRVEIKGEEVIIASSKDTEKSSSKNSNSSIKVTPGAPGFSAEVNVGHREGNGEKEWVSDQTSIIAKEGGIIESKDFTNSGAIIGSESEENKLIVKAENITVEHLKDKDTNKVSGGGIEVTGTGAPNLSVVTGGQDKRQDTNATVVNTEFEIAGESKTAEELGFNTDLDKAQVVTKDEDKVLDAELHTDLLNQSERDKIAEAGEYLESIYKGITDSGVGGKINTIKEQIYGDMLKKAAENYPGFVKFDEKVIDENGEILTDKLNEKGNRVQDLLKYFASSVGYEGEIPRILIGDLPAGEEAFASTLDNTIAIDRNILTSADSNKILSILAHELGHFNGYDSGTESTASRIENTVLGAVSKKEVTGDYEAYFKNMYEGKDISGKEAQKIIDGIPEENKENSTTGYNINVGASFGGRVGAGISRYVTRDYKNDKVTVFHTLDGALQITNPDLDTSLGFSFFPFVNDPTILEGRAHSIGVSFKIPYLEVVGGGFDIIYNTNNEWLGVKFSIGKSFYPFGVRASIADGATIIKKEELTFYEYNKKYHPRGGKNGY